MTQNCTPKSQLAYQFPVVSPDNKTLVYIGERGKVSS